METSAQEELYLMHYGVKRRSGRYPWGSGEDPYQHSGDFLARISELKKTGMNDTEIAKSMGLTTTQFRTQKSLANEERRMLDVARAKSLKADGLSTAEIGRQMGRNESSIRSLLNESSEARMNQAKQTAEFLRSQVDSKGMVEVGVGVERELGISKEKMKQALYMLEMDGYEVYGGGVPQVNNPGRQTNMTVLCPPGTPHKDIYKFDQIHSVTDYRSNDDGETFNKYQYPKSLDSKRVQIRYAEEGGLGKDGVVEIRRGVEDLSLGNSRYAQVRILVDGKKYIKGMAVYADDLPDGVDIMFNTNKKKGTPKLDVLKDIKDDPDNPFGAALKQVGGQSYYTDKNGKKHLSPINKTREEGDWNEWSHELPSQFLSKQSRSLINKQLKLSIADKQSEFDEINSLTNPTVKKALLRSYADDCDAAAVHLKAAALPRQRYQVILPIPNMKDNEVYAPNYNNGEQVALVRYPHGGTFEIPILTVNNRQRTAKNLLGNALDAVGINSRVAEQLSGADFDGDTVMVIPTGGKTRITASKPLEGLKTFDPKMEYGTVKKGNDYINASGSKIKVMNNTQTEMGIISNLITDMTIKGATTDELARAVRHSMVVIDAEKHKLDYKKSAIDNGIAALKKKYQGAYDENGRYHEGASTIISRAKSETQVIKRKGSPQVDPETGKQWYKEDYQEYIDPKTGKTKVRTQKSTKMMETDDAYTLVSDVNNPVERAYADYANHMKSLANQARKEALVTGKIAYSSSAKAAYEPEVSKLMADLNVALKNAPRERRAQIMANAVVAAKKQDNPHMTREEIKKANERALREARINVGAKSTRIQITPRQWEAIQAGAISETKLNQIIGKADMDSLREMATPRTRTTLSSAKMNRLNTMAASGNYTIAEIAQALGVSSSTVAKYMKN